MGIPRKLKDFMLYNDGGAYVGEIASVTLPKLTRKMEEWRGGGMNSPIEIDMGGEVMTLEWTAGGILRDVLGQWGAQRIDAIGLRFAGSYQKDDSGAVDMVEIMVRGRHKEIDMGDAKSGDDTEFKVVSTLSYYKLVWNGVTVIESDPLNMILIVNGDDQLADIRAALGLF